MGAIDAGAYSERLEWADLYQRYQDVVFRFAYFRVGNRHVAEDITQEVFLRAFKRLHMYEDRGKDIGAWLVTIARNLVVDHFKSGRYRLEVTTGDVLDADREDRGPEGSPESAVVDHITNVALLSAVKQLNPEQQECIVLRFIEGLSLAETAQAMGRGVGAIKGLQFRAVRSIARLVNVADGGVTLARKRAEPAPVGYFAATPSEVRAVARANGVAVSALGRLPAEGYMAYERAVMSR